MVLKMDEETLMARELAIKVAAQERESIFQRYDLGREPGNQIDPWEDPQFSVYDKTDRYGFIHDTRLTRSDNPNETKLRALEKEREKKWVKMLKKWKYIESANQKLQPDGNAKQMKGSSSNKLKESVEDKEKLSKRIHKGIPDKLRHLVWKKLLSIDKLMADNKDVYARMLKLARKYSPDVRQIDFDVNRQFREHLFYMERYSTKQKSLFNVLTAYSMYNSEVGYCQGMATVCGVLLMYMDEEESFWALHRLLADPKYAMHGLYIEGFPKLMRFIAHHDKIITKFMPKLKRHFDKNGLDAILYSLKWFFVIFVERIPFSLCLRVWDLYFLEGERVITATAFTILRLHRNKLLKLKDMDLLTEYLQVQLHKDFGYDNDHMIKTLEISMADLKRVKLDLPPAAQANEFAKNKFGDFVEPDFETKIGRRHTIFSDAEREVTENCLMTRNENTSNGDDEIHTFQDLDEIVEDTISSQMNTDDGSHSFLCHSGSRRSYTGTSITSAVDLSLLSFNNSLNASHDGEADRQLVADHQDNGDDNQDAEEEEADEKTVNNCDNDDGFDEKDSFEIIEQLVVDLEQQLPAENGIIRENMRKITLH